MTLHDTISALTRWRPTKADTMESDPGGRYVKIDEVLSVVRGADDEIRQWEARVSQVERERDEAQDRWTTLASRITAITLLVGPAPEDGQTVVDSVRLVCDRLAKAESRATQAERDLTALFAFVVALNAAQAGR